VSQLAIKLGYWSAVMSAILTVGWGIGLTMVMIFFPLPAWTNLAGFVAAVRPASLNGATLGQVAAFLLVPLSVILLCSLHDYAPGDKKILARIGLCCIITSMALVPISRNWLLLRQDILLRARKGAWNQGRRHIFDKSNFSVPAYPD